MTLYLSLLGFGGSGNLGFGSLFLFGIVSNLPCCLIGDYSGFAGPGELACQVWKSIGGDSAYVAYGAFADDAVFYIVWGWLMMVLYKDVNYI